MENYLNKHESVFLVVSEPGHSFADFVVDFLKSNSLQVEKIILDKDFFLNYEKLAKGKKNVYKVILIYGFQGTSQQIIEKIFSFLSILNREQGVKIPLILISTLSTSLDILDGLDFGYQDFLIKQTSFLRSFLQEFPTSAVFLTQDVLVDNKKITHPLLLFFSALKRNYIFDAQNTFYFQDEKSFFNLIKEYLIKPHQVSKFLIRGSKTSSAKLVQKIVYLYEQYFQKKLQIVKLLSNEKKHSFIREFSVVSNSKSQVDEIIDQKIRALIDSDGDLPFLSEKELEEALQISRMQRALQIKKQKAQNRPKKTIVYTDTKTSEKAHKELNKESVVKDFSSEFVSKIEGLFSTQRHQEKKTRQEKNITQGTTILQKSKKRKFLFWLGTVVFGLSFIALSLFSIFNFSQKTIKNQLNMVLSGQLEVKNIDESINYRLFSFQLSQYEKLFSTESLSEAIDLQQLSEIILNLYQSREKFDQAAFDLYKKTIESGVELNDFYEQFLLELDQQIIHQKAFNTYLMDLNLDLYQGQERKMRQDNLEKTKTDLKNNLQLKRFLPVLKDFLLQSGRVNVLILMQDSGELRATGGFLTEAVMFGFNNASLIDQQIFSVNDLDSRVYGQKAASPEIKDLLAEESAFLHDANWQADFAKSGQEMQWFVEQATGSKIDLVLVLNSKTIQKFLTVLGELKINDDLIVDADNLLVKLEETAVADSKNSSKDGFTWLFTNALVNKFMKFSNQDLHSVNEVLIEEMNQKEILLYSSHQALQQAIEGNSWSGKRSELTCPAEFKQDNCLVDSIFQVESNVGINKINSYITQKVEHSLGISEKFIRHKRKIIFENTAPSGLWPLGTYRNYLRFYLHPQANLEKIELNGRAADLDQVKIIDTEQGRELSMLVEIPNQSKIELAVTYLVPNQMSTPFSYVFLDQKQAGVFNKTTDYQIVFEEKFKPQLIAPQARYQDKVIRFENNNLDHFLFAVSFDQ